MTQIINLNKHSIDVVLNGKVVSFSPSGKVATVAVKSVLVGEVEGIPLYHSEYGEIQGLPEPEPDVRYLVNLLVGQRGAAEGRIDLIGPDSGPTAIRENGQIKAVVQFVQF